MGPICLVILFDLERPRVFDVMVAPNLYGDILS